MSSSLINLNVSSERLDAASYLRSKTGRMSTDLVIDHILDGVIAGTILPGDRLNAKRLVEQLNVTVVPVREAIHFLAGEGVVELLPLKGARIREMNAEEVIDWWKVIGAITNLSFEPAVQGLIKYPEKSVLIENAVSAIASSESSTAPIDYLLELIEFHRLITQIGNQSILDEAMRRIQTVYWLTFLPRYMPLDVYAADFTSHSRHVASAILRGDVQSAISAFSHLVEWSSAIIQGERPEPGKPWVKAR